MNLNTFLRGTVIAVVFSACIIPFIVAGNFFFPFITGKAFFFRIVVEIGLIAWILLMLRDASMRPRKSYVLWSFVGFLAVIGISNIFGVNPWKSFWSNFERMEGYITLIHLFAYFLITTSVITTEKLWKRFLESSVLASILVSLYGLLQLSGKITINQGGVRVDATFGNATYLAIYLVFNIFFAVILSLKESVLWKRIILGLSIILNTSILYHTATRGSILGLLGGLFVAAVLIALFDKAHKKIRLIAGSALGLVVLLVIGFMAVKDSHFVTSSPVLNRFASISWNETKTQARAYIWPMAIEGWKERPVFGWGQENFNYIFNEHYNPKMHSQEQWFDHTHNIALDWLVAGGIVGLLGYLSIFVATLYVLWVRAVALSLTEKALWTGLGTAYLFHNLFVFDNLMSYVLFVCVLAYVHVAGTRLEKPMRDDGEFDDNDMRTTAPLIIIAFFFILYFFNIRAINTNTTLIDGLRAMSVNPPQVQAALNSFEKALSYDTLGRPEIVERLIESMRTVQNSSAPLELKQKFFVMAKSAVDTQLSRYPNDARYEMFAANFYSVAGMTAEAEKHALKASELSPRKQTILFQLGSIYMSQKKYVEAEAVFKKAYELETTYTEALKYYIASLFFVGKDDQAKKLAQEKNMPQAQLDEVYMTVLADMGAWTRLITKLKEKLQNEPYNLQTAMNLVSVYYQSGDKNNAVATLQSMIAKDPAFKTQGEQYIRQILGQ